MKPSNRPVLSLLVASLVLAFASSAFAQGRETEASLMSQAKVTQAQASEIALRKLPRGVVKTSELENEHGRLVWSLDVAVPARKGVSEIQVDAKTGKIVSLKTESTAQETKEAKAEQAERGKGQ